MSTSTQHLTLEAFQAARQFTTDLGTALGFEEQKDEPGYVYRSVRPTQTYSLLSKSAADFLLH